MNQENIRFLREDYLEKSTPHPIFSKSIQKQYTIRRISLEMGYPPTVYNFY